MRHLKGVLAAAFFLAVAAAGCPCQPPMDPRDQFQDKATWWTDPPRDQVSYDPDVTADDAINVIESLGGTVLAADDKARTLTVMYGSAGATRLTHITAAAVRITVNNR